MTNLNNSVKLFNGNIYHKRIGNIDHFFKNRINALLIDLKKEDENIQEIIIATNFTKEGDATSTFITELVKDLNKKISRIARGMPSGSEIEYTDTGTLAQAISERKNIN